MSGSHFSLTDSLVWSQVPETKPREYVLTKGDEVLARLRWQKLWGTLAVGESPAGSWSFKRVGFLSSRVTARAVGSETDLASFVFNMFGGGHMELPGGQIWRLRARGFLNQTFELVDQSDTLVVCLRMQGWGTRGEITFGPARPDDKTTFLLLLLIWHVCTLAVEDANSYVPIIAVLCALA